jgi:hypothetical protein
MIPRRSRLAVRRHHEVVVVLAVSIALAPKRLGIDSASASTRSRLAVSRTLIVQRGTPERVDCQGEDLCLREEL